MVLIEDSSGFLVVYEAQDEGFYGSKTYFMLSSYLSRTEMMYFFMCFYHRLYSTCMFGYFIKYCFLMRETIML
jgi:hypothetical protein